MADRIVVMNHGVIEQVGTPQEIYQQPATRFVAEFVGSMNFIETSVVTESQVRIAETLLPAPSLTNRKIQRGDRFDLAVRPRTSSLSKTTATRCPVRITATEFWAHFSAWIVSYKTTAKQNQSLLMRQSRRCKTSIFALVMCVTSSS